MSRKFYQVVLFLPLIFSSACKGEPALPPTTDPGQIETQIAQEVAAESTEIALSQPSATPILEIPSSTPILDQPTELPSFTATTAPVESTSTSDTSQSYNTTSHKYCARSYPDPNASAHGYI